MSQGPRSGDAGNFAVIRRSPSYARAMKIQTHRPPRTAPRPSVRLPCLFIVSRDLPERYESLPTRSTATTARGDL